MKYLEKVAEKEDLRLFINKQCDGSYCIEFEYWSGLGEDCIITLVVDKLTKKEIQKQMWLCADTFDAEENATMWFNMHGEHGTPTSLRALLQDADEQQEKLDSIYETMLKLS